MKLSKLVNRKNIGKKGFLGLGMTSRLVVSGQYDRQKRLHRIRGQRCVLAPTPCKSDAYKKPNMHHLPMVLWGTSTSRTLLSGLRAATHGKQVAPFSGESYPSAGRYSRHFLSPRRQGARYRSMQSNI